MHEYVLGEVPYVEPQRVKNMKKVMRVPPFKSEPVVGAEEGDGTIWQARRHAKMIRAAWARVGQEVNPEIRREDRNDHSYYYVVTPDLVNGLPVKKES